MENPYQMFYTPFPCHIDLKIHCRSLSPWLKTSSKFLTVRNSSYFKQIQFQLVFVCVQVFQGVHATGSRVACWSCSPLAACLAQTLWTGQQTCSRCVSCIDSIPFHIEFIPWWGNVSKWPGISKITPWFWSMFQDFDVYLKTWIKLM